MNVDSFRKVVLDMSSSSAYHCTQELSPSDPVILAHLHVLKGLSEKLFTNENYFFKLLGFLHCIRDSYFPKKVTFEQVLEDNIALTLRKNNDYGPFNIYSTGELGLVVRLNDKVCRMKTLLVNKTESQVKEESAWDTFQDSVNYSIYGVMLLRDQWCTEEEKIEWEEYLTQGEINHGNEKSN